MSIDTVLRQSNILECCDSNLGKLNVKRQSCLCAVPTRQANQKLIDVKFNFEGFGSTFLGKSPFFDSPQRFDAAP